MKKENLVKLLFELIKNSKRSDRDMAKMLGISQPTVTRLRKVLEKEAIMQYTVVPDVAYLGFDILAFTFARTTVPVMEVLDEAKKWAKLQPNVMFATTGQGMEADCVMVSVHKDYANFARYYDLFKKDWGKYVQELKVFLVSLKGSKTIKQFSFNSLVEAAEKQNSR